MMKMKNMIAGLVLAAALFGAPLVARAQGLGQLGSGQLFANATASPARGKATGLSAYLDFAIGATANGFPARISGSWTEAAFGSSFAFSGSTLNLQPSGASTLGGVNSLTCPSHQWFAGLSTLGVFTCSQPALADLPTGSQDTVLGYWTSTVISATSMPNCTGALTYSTSTHTFGCNATTAGNVSNSGTPLAGQIAQWVNATTIQGISLLTEPQGRITLTANTPVMSASATAQTTFRYDCYLGNQVPYFNGTVDQLDTISSCEVTDAMVSAASAGQVVSNNVYDVWWVHGGANRICLAMSASSGGGGGWSADTGGSNTSRGTGYTQLDRITRPYATNKNSIANCFNVATNYGPVGANQGTYLGTVYASGNGQISWTLGAASSGGTAALLGVWNAYNRVNVVTTVTDSGTTYTYSSTTVRQARASAGNQIQFVLGAQEDGIQFSYSAQCLTAAVAVATCQWGVGFDVTNSFSVSKSVQQNSSAAASVTGANTNSGVWSAGVGLHTLAAEEASDGTNANTFDQGTNNALMASLRM